MCALFHDKHWQCLARPRRVAQEAKVRGRIAVRKDQEAEVTCYVDDLHAEEWRAANAGVATRINPGPQIESDDLCRTAVNRERRRTFKKTQKRPQQRQMITNCRQCKADITSKRQHLPRRTPPKATRRATRNGLPKCSVSRRAPLLDAARHADVGRR